MHNAIDGHNFKILMHPVIIAEVFPFWDKAELKAGQLEEMLLGTHWQYKTNISNSLEILNDCVNRKTASLAT
jgi:hypothetical protein